MAKSTKMEEEKYMRRCIELAKNGLVQCASKPDGRGVLSYVTDVLSAKVITFAAERHMRKSMQSVLSKMSLY